MNKFVYAAAGGIAIAAVAVFFLLGPGFAPPGQQERPEVQVNPPVITIRDISVTNVEGDNANVQVSFRVSNPNQRSLYMEAIQYNLHINDEHITMGQWGDIAAGFVAPSEGVLIVSEGFSNITAEPEPAERNSQIAEEWDSMVNGTAQYTVSGTYAYRLTQANLQTTAEEQQTFEVTFP